MNLKDYYESTWDARARLLDACAALTREEWTREFPFSWKTVQRLLGHIIEVERSWMLEDIEQSTYAWGGDEARERLYGTVDLTRATSLEVQALTRRVLDAYVPGRLGETRTGKDAKGHPATFSVEQILTHVFTHELRHQGQLQAMLRLLGKAAPNADWI
jgi:uncharacterized damage-inducible protein DinB